MKKSKVKSQKSKVSGFTLIELLVVFSIIGVLSTVGIITSISFNQEQLLGNSTENIKLFLQRARSQTYSQVNNQCPSGQQFNGYKVLLCCSGTECPQCTSTKDYELNVVCGSSVLPVDSKSFPSGISVDSATTSRSFLFEPITSGVIGGAGSEWQIVIDGFGRKKTITVNSAGVIQ